MALFLHGFLASSELIGYVDLTDYCEIVCFQKISIHLAKMFLGYQ